MTYNENPNSSSQGMPEYIRLNAELNFYGPNKEIRYDKDREAVRDYFLNEVNPNTVYFHTLDEKLNYLITENYYEKEFLDLYSKDFIKKLFQNVYTHKFRFTSFVSALKFYGGGYALKMRGQNRFLERFEDRIAIVALYLGQGNEKAALKLAEEMITGRYQPATPTFLNSGKKARGELISCFLLNVNDDLSSIMRSVTDAAQLSKRGGGVALNLSNLRGKDDPIKGIPGAASGVIPVMKILEDTFSYANQLGARQGAGAVYLNAHHIDIMDFLDTKRENADEKVRIKTLSLGVVIPDITFQLARDKEEMYLFSPHDMQKVYGEEFAWLNISDIYREAVDNPDIRKKKIDPRAFLSTLAEIQMESGYPYIMFEDAANRASQLTGKITMSNLCVTGDTLILTDNGYRKAADLYATQEDFSVVVDDRARLMDKTKRNISIQPSTRMMKTAENADIFELTTLEGHSIKATEWHKFYIERDGKIVKLQMNELIPGDKLLMQPAAGTFGTIHEPELAYIAGVVAADGTFAHAETTAGNITSSVKINLHGTKKTFAGKLEGASATVLAERTDLLERQATLTPKFTPSTETQGDFEGLSSAPLAKLFSEKGFTAETKTSVPQFVIEGDKETQTAYVDGLFALDGTVFLAKDNISVQLGSTNHDYLVEVQRLLLNLGIYSRIYDAKKETTMTAWPDGSEYISNRSWSLRVSTTEAVEKLLPLVEWKPEIQTKADAAMERIANKTKGHYDTHKSLATVKEMKWVGIEDVYDVTVENGNSLIFNGFSTGNCSEILQPQTPSVLNDDQTFETVGKDINCNLGSLNVRKALESPDFGSTIETAFRSLVQVSDLSGISAVPSVKRGNDTSHSVGLGAMNLHGAFAFHGIEYGSEESIDFTNMYFYLVTYHAIRTNNLIAKEKGQSFEGFEDSTYASGEYFERFINPARKNFFKPRTSIVKKIFGDMFIPESEDWEKLARKVKKYGLYSSHMQAVPPTGSISYINNSTSSIHPVDVPGGIVMARAEGKLGTVYYPTPEAEGREEFYRNLDMFTIDSKKVIDVYSVAQYYVDQGLSLTLGYKSSSTTRNIVQNVMYSFSKGKKVDGAVLSEKQIREQVEAEGKTGAVAEEETQKRLRVEMLKSYPQGEIKTMYYVRMMNENLEATQNDMCVSCML